MLQMEPLGWYADAMERALYNTCIAGMDAEGRRFFYVNPLEVLPEACHKDPRKHHVKPVRQKWFSCACCPPNLARLLCSVGEYCFTENAQTLYIHQYLGSSFDSRHGHVDIESDYAFSGAVTVRIRPEQSFTLAVRIPRWSPGFEASLPCTVKDGYACFEIREETELSLQFHPMPTLTRCSNRVRENAGKVAVTKGPFVYCLEEVDNGKDLHQLVLRKDTGFTSDGEWLLAEGFREKDDPVLYSPWREPEYEPVTLRFLPYYRWANRGENEMCVYVRI